MTGQELQIKDRLLLKIDDLCQIIISHNCCGEQSCQKSVVIGFSKKILSGKIIKGFVL